MGGLVLPLFFVAFSLRGGVVLRVLGWSFLACAFVVLFLPQGNASDVFGWVAFGVAFLLVGHWAYAFAYFHYKSSLAEQVIERGVFPLVKARSGRYMAQGPFASALRNSGVLISRALLRSASGVEKMRLPAVAGGPGEEMPSAETDRPIAAVELARSRVRDWAVATRERLGVSNRRFERVRESLVDEQALSAELREQIAELHGQIDVLEARDHAREGRLATALADAGSLVRGLDRSVLKVAALLTANRAEGEREIATALQEMLASHVRSVEILRAQEAPADLLAFARERGGATTSLKEQADTGEHSLEVTVAVAGQRMILVRYAEGVFDDGPLVGLVEELSRAVVASLEGRDIALEKGRRLPVSLLGDERACRRLAVLREAQGILPARIVVRIDEDAYEQFTGVFGEPAWNAELFELARELDGAAREMDGEVFEIANELVCLVGPAQRGRLRPRFDAIVARRNLTVEVLDG